MRRIFAITVIAVLSLLPGGTTAHSYLKETDLVSSSKINDVYVIHFVLDGLNLKAFNKAMEEEKLPTLKEMFMNSGATFTGAVSSFPSTSTTVYQSYTTGLLPGHSGIPHLERFDRQRREVIGYFTVAGHKKINSDLINLRALTNPNVAEIEPPTTIFELLEGYPTAAIYSSFYRGAGIVYPKIAPFEALWSTFVSDNAGRVDMLAMNKVMKLFEGDMGDIPRYSLVGLYSADIFGHEYGPDSREVGEAIVQLDLFLRSFMDLLKERGLAQKTYVIVSADHGMHASGKLFELQKELDGSGVFMKPKSPRVKNWSVYAANRGVVSSQIYARHDGGFEPLENFDVLRRLPAMDEKEKDLIDIVLNLSATGLFVIRNGERKAKVFSRDGRSADISCFTLNMIDHCSYECDDPRGDPLDLQDDPLAAKMLDGEPHSTRAWLEATSGGKYPDAVIQLSQIFHDGRAGDAFIVAGDGWGFRKVKAGNHGGAESGDMRVPLMINGPGVPRGTFGAARTTDIYPLLIEWFGLNVPLDNHDGIDPFKPRAGEDPRWQKLAVLEAVFDRNPPLMKMVDVHGFVRKEAYAAVRPLSFKTLLPLAREEQHRRSVLAGKLRDLYKEIELQKMDAGAPRAVSDDYLDDHMDIVRRARDLAVGSSRRMEDMVTILSKCANPASNECLAL